MLGRLRQERRGNLPKYSLGEVPKAACGGVTLVVGEAHHASVWTGSRVVRLVRVRPEPRLEVVSILRRRFSIRKAGLPHLRRRGLCQPSRRRQWRCCPLGRCRWISSRARTKVYRLGAACQHLLLVLRSAAACIGGHKRCVNLLRGVVVGGHPCVGASAGRFTTSEVATSSSIGSSETTHTACPVFAHSANASRFG